MSFELFYTSAPKGLNPGTRGFCTVAMTLGMPVPLIERLEMLSGYRLLFPAGDPSEASNPPAYAHWRLTVGKRVYNVLSRVAFAGFDYSGRSNKFAHHVALEPSELAWAGPAWIMRQPGVHQSAWEGEPRLLAAGKMVPRGDGESGPCRAWAAMVGDAGWAAALAQSFRDDPARPASIIFSPGMDLLPLIDEAMRLLSPQTRWQVTFSVTVHGIMNGRRSGVEFYCVAERLLPIVRASRTQGVPGGTGPRTSLSAKDRHVGSATGRGVAAADGTGGRDRAA